MTVLMHRSPKNYYSNDIIKAKIIYNPPKRNEIIVGNKKNLPNIKDLEGHKSKINNKSEHIFSDESVRIMRDCVLLTE